MGADHLLHTHASKFFLLYHYRVQMGIFIPGGVSSEAYHGYNADPELTGGSSNSLGDEGAMNSLSTHDALSHSYFIPFLAKHLLSSQNC